MNVALILAAGRGSRFGYGIPKQFVQLKGQAILDYSLAIVEELDEIEKSIIVIDPVYEKLFRKIANKYEKQVEFCAGGSTRQVSVYNGLKHLSDILTIKDNPHVLIHDSARPFAKKVFQNVLKKISTKKAVIPVVNTKDTIYVIKEKRITTIPCRDHLYNVQTPQGFLFQKILQCHKIAYEKSMTSFSDDGSLYLKLTGEQPAIVDGDPMNFKITDKSDLLLGEYYLSKEKTSP